MGYAQEIKKKVRQTRILEHQRESDMANIRRMKQEKDPRRIEEDERRSEAAWQVAIGRNEENRKQGMDIQSSK